MCVAGSRASAATSPLVRGAQLLTQARPKAALAEFLEAVKADPTCAEAYCGIGGAKLHAGDTAGALASLQAALALDPTSRPARLGIASALFQQGEYDKALVQYRYCLAFDCAERAPVRAAEAYSACMLGLYEVAAGEAALALREDPTCELARVVAGAAGIARGDAQGALGVLEAEAPAQTQEQLAPRFALVTPSPLFSPTAHYYIAHNLSDASRLAFLGPAATSGYPSPSGRPAPEPEEEPAPTEPEVQTGGLRITQPRAGAVIAGLASVAVEAPDNLNVEYMALLVDDEFRTISNSKPFRVSLDTKTLDEGQHRLRVDGYGPHGDVIATTSVLVMVRQGLERTLSYEEQTARRAVGRQLERLLVIRAAPGGRWQLVGHALEMLGRLDDAVIAFEEAFCRQPTATGIRADLLTAYQQQGLAVGTKSHEVHFPTRAGTVALSFDDGPHPIVTPRLLDVLDRYQVKATFFLVGKQVELYPELAAEIVRRGHEVGSHSYSHSNLGQLPKLYVERELVKSRLAIRRATGRTVTLFRPPGGNYDRDVRDAAAETGFSAVFWTANIGNCRGWEPPAIVAKFTNELREGGIVLMHNGEDESLSALPGLLTALGNERRLVGTVGAANGGKG